MHERTSKGRMPLVGDVRTIEVGTELVDWTLDPLEVDGGLDVVTAGKDGKLRVWRVPKDGLKEVLHEPTKILDGELSYEHKISYHRSKADNPSMWLRSARSRQGRQGRLQSYGQAPSGGRFERCW